MKSSRVKKDQSHTHALASFLMPKMEENMKAMLEKRPDLSSQLEDNTKTAIVSGNAQDSASAEEATPASKDGGNVVDGSVTLVEAETNNTGRDTSAKDFRPNTAAAETDVRKTALPSHPTPPPSPHTSPPRNKSSVTLLPEPALTLGNQAGSSLTLREILIQVHERVSGQDEPSGSSTNATTQVKQEPASKLGPYPANPPPSPTPKPPKPKLAPDTPPPTPPPSRPPTPPPTPPPRPRTQLPSNSSSTTPAQNGPAGPENDCEPPQPRSRAPSPPPPEPYPIPKPEIGPAPLEPQNEVEGGQNDKPTSPAPHPVSPNRRPLKSRVESDTKPATTSNPMECVSPSISPPNPEPTPPQPPPFPDPPSPPN